MKIISKYKDFYDYLVQDHDSDLVWVRKVGYAQLDDRRKYYDVGDFMFGISYRIMQAKDSIRLSYEVFGIYPHIYCIPIAKVRYHGYVNVETEKIVISRSAYDSLLAGDEDTFIKYVCDNLSDYAQEYIKQNNIKLTYQKHINSVNVAWKKECPEIFEKFDAPIFAQYNSCGLPNEYINEDILEDYSYRWYVTNPVFSKFTQNILKYWFDEVNTVNTYNNIENFLWSKKQEPVSESDNKTKILSHGFDLKTSFRKM